MEEAMKRVREAQSLISAAIEPGSGWIKVKTACFFFFWGGGEFELVFRYIFFSILFLQTRRTRRSDPALVQGQEGGIQGPTQGTGRFVS